MSTALTVGQQRAISTDELYGLSQQFKQYPYLERETELELAKQVQEHGDKEAAQKLILSHMRYVISVVKNYLSYGLSAHDLVQEGTVGLMKAVKNYVPSEKVRLVSYASHWIKAEIHEFILKNWRMVKVATTKAQRKLFFNLKKLRKQIGFMSQTDAEEIAKTLDVKPSEVITMDERLSGTDASFDGITNDEDDNINQAPANTLSYANDNPQELVIKQQWFKRYQNQLSEAIKHLPEREKIILEQRWLTDNHLSLKQLGENLNVSLERVRQLEKSALVQLRAQLQDLV